MSVEFELEGQGFMALNAGPPFTFTEAISFFGGVTTLFSYQVTDTTAPRTPRPNAGATVACAAPPRR